MAPVAEALVCAVVLGVVPVLGCTDEAGPGGGGTAGSGGMGGEGGCGGYAGGPAFSCVTPPAAICESSAVGPIQPCCEPPAPPTQETACDGTESLENPASCSPTGIPSVYRLTSLKVAADCNVGFEIDGCYGLTCPSGRLASEGLHGVDNVVATIDHAGINQLFADALCGSTRAQGPACETAIPQLDIVLAVETNVLEQCANVTLSTADGEVGRVILNLRSATPAGTRCASGSLGVIPLTLGGTEITLEHTVARMTISNAGFSHGLLGATLAADDAVELAEAAIPELGAGIADFFDLRDNLWPSECTCNGLSGTYEIGGVAQN